MCVIGMAEAVVVLVTMEVDDGATGMPPNPCSPVEKENVWGKEDPAP